MVCKYCGYDRPPTDFWHGRAKCKPCKREHDLKRQRTRYGLKSKMYSQIVQRSKRFDRVCDFSEAELSVWLDEHGFESLYIKWAKSKYDKWLIPSVDRLDDFGGYTFDNMQLLTWYENKQKFHKDRKSGKSLKAVQPVARILSDGTKIYYHSSREAERETGINHSSILRVCDGHQRTAKNTIWTRVTILEYNQEISKD